MTDRAPLLRRIRALSRTTRPLFVSGDTHSPEDVMRANAERTFQYALLTRIFWNLTRDERDLIRRSVLAEHPEYGRSMHGPSFDLECVREVARVLEQLPADE